MTLPELRIELQLTSNLLGSLLDREGDLEMKRMLFPSVQEYVKMEMGNEDVRELSEILSDRDSKLFHLETVKFTRSQVTGKSLFTAGLKMPSKNLIRQVPMLPSLKIGGYLTQLVNVELFQHTRSFYTSTYSAKGHSPEVFGSNKIKEILIPTNTRISDLINILQFDNPIRKSYDSQRYSNAWMLLVPIKGTQSSSKQEYFVLNSPSTEADYSELLVNVEKKLVGDLTMDDILPITDLVETANFMVLVHTGNETDRIILSNIRYVTEEVKNVILARNAAEQFVHQIHVSRGCPDISFREIYRKSQRKLTWCGICGIKVSDYSVIDDPWLPETPFFVCIDCYRLLRTDENGDFIQPGPETGIYDFAELVI
jgi:snRNA-activating protein complex (SNAPc), subunit 3